MNKMWFSTHKTWYEGVAERMPSTNNGLESFNNVIKKEETLRERMPVGQFVSQCLVSASRWSKQYSFDKSIATKPTISLEDWTSAYQWAKSRQQIRSKRLRDFTQYFCPPSKKDSLPEAEVRRAKVRSWTTFEDFRKNASAVRVVQMKNDEWDDATCSCPRFLREYKCKHIIGMAIRLQLVHAPPQAN